jgi:hypothetical protein
MDAGEVNIKKRILLCGTKYSILKEKMKRVWMVLLLDPAKVALGCMHVSFPAVWSV